jgi:hypothetical protein
MMNRLARDVICKGGMMFRLRRAGDAFVLKYKSRSRSGSRSGLFYIQTKKSSSEQWREQESSINNQLVSVSKGEVSAPISRAGKR